MEFHSWNPIVLNKATRSSEGARVSAFESSLSESSDKERLKTLVLLSLDRGSLMGDLIEVYEILKVMSKTNKTSSPNA